MQPDNTRKLKRYISLLIIAVILIMGASWLFRSLTTGKVTIKTDNSTDFVSIQNVDTSGKGTYFKQKEHSMTVHVKPGHYTIKAFSKSFSTSKDITVTARKSTTYTLNPIKTAPLEAVLSQGAGDAIVDSRQMLFISAQTKNLTRLNTDNTVQTIDNTKTLASVRWSSISQGLAQDLLGNFYTVTAGGLKPFTLPSSIDTKNPVSYDVTTDGDIYITSGADIYTGGSAGNFKKVYTANFQKPRLAASSDRVAINYTGAEDEEGATAGNVSPAIIVISSTGQELAKNKDKAYQVIWSKDGKHLLARGDKGITVYDTSLKKIGSANGNSVGSMAWIDNNTVLFSNGPELWRFSLADGNATKISRGPSGDITALFPSIDQKYIYIDTDTGDEVLSSKLLRMSLTGKAAPVDTQIIGIFLPKQGEGCSLDYVNFTKPTVTIQVNTTVNTTQNCLQKTKDELKYYDISPTQFDLKVIPS